MVTHLPLWSLVRVPTDLAEINAYLLPLLRQQKFDLYLNGHERVTSFAHIKKDAIIQHAEQPEFESKIELSEYWFDQTKKERFSQFD